MDPSLGLGLSNGLKEDTRQDTSSASAPSLLDLQITELLSELNLGETLKASIDDWFHKLLLFLESIPTSESYDLSIQRQSWMKSMKVEQPAFWEPSRTMKGFFRFAAPAKVLLIGSYPLNTTSSLPVSVDVSLEMPGQIMQDRDFLNQVYNRKRALYLAYVAGCLKSSDLTQALQFSYFHQDPARPVLVVKPKGTLGIQCAFVLHAVPPDGFWKPNRFAASKSNIRTAWFFSKTGVAELPTPRYNSSILSDMSLSKHTDFFSAIFSEVASKRIIDGIKLLKVWLHKRELDSGHTGFSGFVLTALVAQLIRKKKLSKHINSLQVFRMTLAHLSNIDWDSKGLLLCDALHPDGPSLPELLSTFPVVLIDAEGVLNLAANMSAATLNRVKHEAQLSLSYLDDRSIDVFQLLFLTKISWNSKFDHLFHISRGHGAETALQAVASQSDGPFLDSCGNYIFMAATEICNVVERALGERVELLEWRLGNIAPWNISAPPPTLTDYFPLTVGLLFSKHNFKETLHRGPEANGPGAAEFRDFWGPDVKLRRFADGSITESVVWKAPGESDKRLICGQIVKHALQRHLALDHRCVHYVGNIWDKTLELQRVNLPTDWPRYTTGEEYLQMLIAAYDVLSRDLWELSGSTAKKLPLGIVAVRTTSPSVRCTEVFPPLPASFSGHWETTGMKLHRRSALIQPFVQPLPVQVVMEGSSKWPSDREAIFRLKAAFQLQIAEGLKSQDYVVVVRDVRGLQVWKKAYCFFVQVVYLGEIQLARKVTLPDGRAKLENTHEYHRLFLDLDLLPKLSTAIAGVARQDESFGTACRVAKRWIASQLLHHYISNECVELLMAHVYLSPYPETAFAPVSPDVAFIRFLGLIQRHDWQNCPLIVNFNSELTTSDLENLSRMFSPANRSTFPAVMVITPFDRSSSWTRNFSTIILKRLLVLSKVSLQAANFGRTSATPFDPKVIFRPPKSDWDVTIHLKMNLLSRRHEALDLDFTVDEDKKKNKNKKPQKFHALKYENEPTSSPQDLLLNFDTAGAYVDLLRENYGDCAYFFADPYGGNMVAVVWKTSQFVAVPFRESVLSGHAVKEVLPTDVVGKKKMSGPQKTVTVNVTAMLEDFALLGRGLVDNIDICSAKWKI